MSDTRSTEATNPEPAVPARFRPDARIIRGLGWRALLVIVATVSILLGLPAWARAPLSVAAALITVTFLLSRSRRRGPIDDILTVLGIVVMVLALLGLLLNVLPSGITTTSWGLGVGILEISGLVTLAYWRAPNAARTRRRVRISSAAVNWTVLTSLVLAGALIWSISSFTSTHVAPLALAAANSGGSVTVTVSSGSDEGPYELEVVKGATRTTLAGGIFVGPGNAASITLTVPSDTREEVQLVRAGSTTSLRELILDTTTAKTKATQ